MSLQNKMFLLFFGLAISMITILISSIFFFTQRFAFEDFYKRLEARANIGAEVYMREDDRTLLDYKKIRDKYLERLPAENDYFFQIDGNRVVDQDSVPNLPNVFFDEIIRVGHSRYNRNNDFYAGKKFHQGDDEFAVIVHAKDPAGFRELAVLQQILVVCFFVSLLVVYFVGKMFLTQLFKPFKQIIREIQKISAENLHQRLPTRRSNDEITEISVAFNDMLDRLETAFETQSNFVSNASHELRTPISIIRGEIELFLASASITDSQRASLQVALEEIDKLQEIINGLLYLAKASSDQQLLPDDAVRLDQVLMNIKKINDQMNSNNQVQLDFKHLPEDERLITVQGHEHLLHLAIANLVANACKYSNNKPVKLALENKEDKVVISVFDRGIGIPEKETQFIFEPFFRASNTKFYEGHGVGLPLAQKIIRLHRGEIIVNTSVNEGTQIQVILPIAAC